MRLHPSRAAGLVVDMENDFGAVGGMFHRAGLDISGIQAAIVPTARVIEAARWAGIPVVYLKMAFRADLSDMGPEGAPHRGATCSSVWARAPTPPSPLETA